MERDRETRDVAPLEIRKYFVHNLLTSVETLTLLTFEDYVFLIGTWHRSRWPRRAFPRIGGYFLRLAVDDRLPKMSWPLDV
jgi:hypothetical protein